MERADFEVELPVMITVAQIREQLLNLLDSKSANALDEFDEWFAGASWNMHKNADLPTQRFAAEVELKMAEFESGAFDEPSLRRQISELVRLYSLQLSSNPVMIVSGSSSSFTSTQQWAISPVGRKLVTA